MTIGLWDIVVPKTKKARCSSSADEAVAAIDKQFQRGLITEDERYEQVVELVAADHEGRLGPDDGLARRREPRPDDDRLRRPR